MQLLILTSLLVGSAASSIGDTWLNQVFTDLPSHPQAAKLEGLKRVKGLIENYQTKSVGDAVHSEFPYFNFLPQFVGGVKAGADAITWTGRCGGSNAAVSAAQEDGSVKVSITTSGLAAGCAENYDVMTVTGMKHISVDENGTFEFDWTLPEDARDAEVWDLGDKGVRLFAYKNDIPTTVADALETVLMFIPEETKTVDPVSARRNVDFMAKYPQFVMEERDPLSQLPPPAHKVHSGDFFGIIRLDGLDPMLAWAMGSTTGHTTTALWMDGELYITESTVTDSYWPTNGIQKTPYEKWLKQAEEASFQVVWAPLNKEYRARYNETAAVEFFKENEGLDYGYRNMLWGWVDTLTDNYPCVPNDYTSVCTQWEFFETLFGALDRKAPDLVNMFVNQAFNFRLGTSDLRFPEILQEASKQGIASKAIPTIPEQDSWMYQTTRNEEPAVGRSMVCCVYVCSSWKAAGIFGDNEVNCGEFTNVDDYDLAIFEDEYTQIMGRWTLKLNRYNIKNPYPHMAETCASLAPDYEQAVDC